MEKEIITVDGEDKVVRADTAKSYRGVIWALTSVGIIVIILAVLFLGGFLTKSVDGNLKNPATIENSTRK